MFGGKIVQSIANGDWREVSKITGEWFKKDSDRLEHIVQEMWAQIKRQNRSRVAKAMRKMGEIVWKNVDLIL